MFISELEELEDILNTLVFEDKPSVFDEEISLQLIETALYLMEDFMNNNPTIISEPDFHDIFLDEIKELFYVQMEEYILDDDYFEDDMDELLEEAFTIYTTIFLPERSIQNGDIIKFNDDDYDNNDDSSKSDPILNKIQLLRELPQPVQRTPEWYKFRWNLITASNAWKAFETQNTINQLIYEKCQPLKTFEDIDGLDDEIKMVNTNTPLHWGQKYEPLSVMIYEDMYKTKVEDFGCIQHPTYKFLGASPDGIVINKDSTRFGRMLEIKNPISREITGIPKKEYWVQMQLQMEVCDLDECDFLETKFTEYFDADSYYNDNTINNENYKGIIIYFHTSEGKPFYVYKPLNLNTEEEIKNWEEENVDKYQGEPYNYIYMKFIYWKLDKLSCILVLRNKEWFKNNIGQLEKVWKIIEEERISGYEHRAPIKKQKKETNKPYVEQSQGCLLKIIKLT